MSIINPRDFMNRGKLIPQGMHLFKIIRFKGPEPTKNESIMKYEVDVELIDDGPLGGKDKKLFFTDMDSPDGAGTLKSFLAAACQMTLAEFEENPPQELNSSALIGEHIKANVTHGPSFRDSNVLEDKLSQFMPESAEVPY